VASALEGPTEGQTDDFSIGDLLDRWRVAQRALETAEHMASAAGEAAEAARRAAAAAERTAAAAAASLEAARTTAEAAEAAARDAASAVEKAERDKARRVGEHADAVESEAVRRRAFHDGEQAAWERHGRT
jgi:hypothetical protein